MLTVIKGLASSSLDCGASIWATLGASIVNGLVCLKPGPVVNRGGVCVGLADEKYATRDLKVTGLRRFNEALILEIAQVAFIKERESAESGP